MHPKLFKADDPFANPETAARELIRIMKAEMETKERPFAYVGTVNSVFISASCVKSYSAGRDFGMANNWFKIIRAGCEFHLTPEGEDA
jgi:hypothetical protein